MTTLTKIFSLVMIWAFSTAEAQQIFFENINSSNALNIITQLSSGTTAAAPENIILQMGTQNYAELNLNGNTSLGVQQLGDYNFLNFDNAYNNQLGNSVITTQGSNNIIDIVGSNSISENLQIHVKGDNMTMFIRNY